MIHNVAKLEIDLGLQIILDTTRNSKTFLADLQTCRQDIAYWEKLHVLC